MTNSIVSATAPTFLQWVPDARGALHLIREPALICPQCGDPCGHLFHDADTPKGACLSCKVADDAIAQYERRETEELGTPVVAWHPRPKPGQIVCTECNMTRAEWDYENDINPNPLLDCCEG